MTTVAYKHVKHPRVERRNREGPVRIADQLPHDSRYARVNAWVAVKITNGVGTMTCAYIFTIISLISLPAAIMSGQVIVIIEWVAQTFLQLVLLSIIIVGQNIMAAAADKRAESTFEDADATLHEAGEIQKHLLVQDASLNALADKLAKLTEHLAALVTASNEAAAG